MEKSASLKKTLENEKENLKTFGDNIKKYNGIVFLGMTKSGKSSLINYLLGNKLEAFQDLTKAYKLEKVGDEEGPNIGKGTLSCTTKPTYYRHKTNESYYVDPPGLVDNRGEEQNVLNTLYIHHIKNASKIKFVLVADINGLLIDGADSFIRFFNLVHRFLPECERITKSFSIVFTKVKDHNQSEIQQLLEEKILNVENLALNKILIRYLANASRIGIFKTPEKAGQVDLTTIGNNLIRCIESSEYELGSKIKFDLPISPDAELLIHGIYEVYLQERLFKDAIDKITKECPNYDEITSNIGGLSSKALTTTKLYLEDLKKRINAHIIKNYSGVEGMLQLEKEFKFKFSADLDLLNMIDETELSNLKQRTNFTKLYNDYLQSFNNSISDRLTDINKEKDWRGTKRNVLIGSAVAGTVIGGGVGFVVVAGTACAVGGGAVVGAAAGSGIAYGVLKYAESSETD